MLDVRITTILSPYTPFSVSPFWFSRSGPTFCVVSPSLFQGCHAQLSLSSSRSFPRVTHNYLCPELTRPIRTPIIGDTRCARRALILPLEMPLAWIALLVPTLRVCEFIFTMIVCTDVRLLDNGAKSCIPARAGYFCPTSGMKTEYSCAAGTYSGVAGSTSCSPCPPGHECPSGSLANPQPCSPGRFSVGGNVVTCTSCPAGFFNNIHGSTGCCACCAGHFNVWDFPIITSRLADSGHY